MGQCTLANLGLLVLTGTFFRLLHFLRAEDWKSDYHIRYKLSDFIGKVKGNDDGPTNTKVRIGLLDSGISQSFALEHPSIQMADFTDDKDPHDSTGHGTFSMGVI